MREEERGGEGDGGGEREGVREEERGGEGDGGGGGREREERDEGTKEAREEEKSRLWYKLSLGAHNKHTSSKQSC